MEPSLAVTARMASTIAPTTRMMSAPAGSGVTPLTAARGGSQEIPLTLRLIGQILGES